MAVHNAMPYLPCALDSVFGQRDVELEVVVVDDGSTDGSSAYLQALSDPRLVLVTQANAGLAVA